MSIFSVFCFNYLSVVFLLNNSGTTLSSLSPSALPVVVKHSSNYLPCWQHLFPIVLPIICLVGQVNPIIWLFGTLPIYLPIICLVGNVFFQLFASSSSPPSSFVDNIHPVISFFHHLAIICTGDNYSSNFALLGALRSISLLTAPSSDVCHDGDKDNRDNMLGGCISVATSKLGTSSNYLPWFLLFALLATLIQLFDTSSDYLPCWVQLLFAF